MDNVYKVKNDSRVSRELMLELFSSLNSMKDLEIRLFGVPGSTSQIRIRSIIKYFNLQAEFEVFKYGLKMNQRRNLSKSEIFKENSDVCSSTVKRYIHRNKLITYMCAICNCLPNWQNKELTLQLDHINGINTDNRLENLRFLCPNCHSQTDTYASRNSKVRKGYATHPCKTCHNPVRLKAEICRNCYNKTQGKHKVKYIEKEDFITLLENFSLAEIASVLKVSYSEINNRLKELDLLEWKTPGGGYWRNRRMTVPLDKELMDAILSKYGWTGRYDWKRTQLKNSYKFI